MSALILEGLDGSNPLAFLAALGVLNVLSDAVDGLASVPTLAWRDEGVWRPVIDAGTELTGDALIEAVLRDKNGWATEPALQLKYAKAKGGKEAADLKPPPDRYVEFLRTVVNAAHATRSRRSADLVAAFATDVAVDNGGNTKPTALHFTAGQQEFLTMVNELRAGVTREDVTEALFGPWRYERPLPVLQWDNRVSRDYALRATDPSKDKKLGVPGADWLALRGLSFVRAFPDGDRIRTTGCSREGRTERFRWPLWTRHCGREVIQSILSLPESELLRSRAESENRGIGVVFESGVRRQAKGYGGFSPSIPL